MKIKVAYASVPGFHHIDNYGRNQDAVHVEAFKDKDGDMLYAGTVCDGCSGGKIPEMSSIFFSRYITNVVTRLACKEEGALLEAGKVDTFFSLVKRTILDKMFSYVEDLTLSDWKNDSEKIMTIYETMLFTIMGFLVRKDKLYIFSKGDGYYNVNGEETIIDQDNKPDYLAYEIIPNAKITRNFKVVFLHLDNFEYVVISTDGIQYLREKENWAYHREKRVPGMQEFLDIYGNSCMMLQKFYQMMVKHRILYDDTSTIVLKSIKNESENQESVD